MFAHDGDELPRFSLAAPPGFVTHEEFIVYLTGHKTTVIGDFSELDGERTRCVDETCAWLVAMDDLFQGGESLEAF